MLEYVKPVSNGQIEFGNNMNVKSKTWRGSDVHSMYSLPLPFINVDHSLDCGYFGIEL